MVIISEGFAHPAANCAFDDLYWNTEVSQTRYRTAEATDLGALVIACILLALSPQGTHHMMVTNMPQVTSATRSMELVRTMMSDIFNERSYDLIPELLAEDFVQHGSMPGTELTGQDAWRENIEMYHGAFSDLEATEELQFGDGEYVCSHYTFRGTHDGEFMGIPATDEIVEIQGTIITRIEDDRIAERWVSADLHGLLQGIGSVPSIDEIAA